MSRPGVEARQAGERRLLTELVELLAGRRAGTLDRGLAPAWRQAADDAERLRVVVDQVAQLTDSSARAWHARLAGPPDATAPTRVVGDRPRLTPWPGRIRDEDIAAGPREVADRRGHRRARPAAQRRRRQPQGPVPVPRREVAVAVGVAGPRRCTTASAAATGGDVIRFVQRDRAPATSPRRSSGWPPGPASSCATSTAAPPRRPQRGQREPAGRGASRGRGVLRRAAAHRRGARRPGEFLHERGFDEAAAARFGCGFAPARLGRADQAPAGQGLHAARADPGRAGPRVRPRRR